MFPPGVQRESSSENAVVVAVKAEKEISKTALEWALTHIVRPGDFVTLLAVIPTQNKGRRWRLWGFPRFSGDCGSRMRQNCPEAIVSASCSQMALQFHGAGGQTDVNMRIKVVMPPDGAPSGGGGGGGAVAAESRRVGANWIVLDKQLEHEAKQCVAELNCNIVLMKRGHARVLRLNLGGLHSGSSTTATTTSISNKQSNPPPIHGPLPLSPPEEEPKHRRKHSTPISSPDDQDDSKITSVVREYHAASSSNSSASASPFPLCEQSNPLFERFRKMKLGSTDDERLGRPWAQDYWAVEDDSCKTDNSSNANDSGRTLQEKFAQSDQNPVKGWTEIQAANSRDQQHLKDSISIVAFRASPSMPPPLCSMCQHKTPVFGKPPKWFSYGELEDATNQFSEENFLAEGGFGWVHRGVLPDGQVVAVKRLKVASGYQGDAEFRSEVEVLSRAQHRNVVLLIGFCAEGKARILVYEYICNGSLDSHLYGRNRPPLDWHARSRIAIGAARGLRYLHEDCRVGFVHRDVRPSNILLTHDYEPLIGDFGLAKWWSEGAMGVVDSRVVGTFGYLAPEYIETGAITEKADVYAFGVVLLELLTGRRAMDLSRPKGQQFLVEWARPLLMLPAAQCGGGAAPGTTKPAAIDLFLDPRLNRDQARLFATQLTAMAHAASLCLARDPQSRPGMSKVLRILEGDDATDPPELRSKGSRAGRVGGFPSPKKNAGPKGSCSHRFSNQAVTSAVMCADRSSPCALTSSHQSNLLSFRYT